MVFDLFEFRVIEYSEGKLVKAVDRDNSKFYMTPIACGYYILAGNNHDGIIFH